MAHTGSILPDLISISRDCGYTRELADILSIKLDAKEIDLLHRWVQVTQQEQSIDKNHAVKKARGW
jgi:hypothetical protein